MRPGFLGRIARVTGVVVVDELQPVAAIVGKDELFGQQVSWAHLTEPPAMVDFAADNRRRMWRLGEAFVVQDPGQPPIQISMAKNGSELKCEVTQQPRSPGEPVRTAVAKGRLTSNNAAWGYSTLEGGFRRSACIELRSAELKTWVVGRASIVDASLIGEDLLVIMRRADKRPWAFDPQRELWVFTRFGDPRLLVAPKITRSWRPASAAMSDSAVADAFQQAQRDSEVAVEQLRARNISITAKGLGHTLTVSLAFDLPDGRRLTRVNQPFNALGLPTGGLAGQSIWLDEDISSGIAELEATMDGFI